MVSLDPPLANPLITSSSCKSSFWLAACGCCINKFINRLVSYLFFFFCFGAIENVSSWLSVCCINFRKRMISVVWSNHWEIVLEILRLGESLIRVTPLITRSTWWRIWVEHMKCISIQLIKEFGQNQCRSGKID